MARFDFGWCCRRIASAARWCAVAVCMVGLATAAVAADEPYGWKAGVARAKITPQKMMWMAGYAARTAPAEGVAQDLFAKALAIEDADGNRLVMVTHDLIGITARMRAFVEQHAGERFGLPPEGILLNASHTHCGPEFRESIRRSLTAPAEQYALADEYSAWLEQQIVELIGAALADLQPAQVGYSHARCAFAMNRRLPLADGYRNSPYPDGPVDHLVPVLRVSAPDGTLRAVMFGYACHNTTLGFNMFCGDYAGYAQQYIEEAHPGATALFMMGCAGDQNPYPRRTIELCRTHGRTLATAVEAALEPQAKPLAGPLTLRFEKVTLDFAPPPSRGEFEHRLKSTNRYQQAHAERMLKMLDEQGSLITSYDYPVQTARFGNGLLLVALGGEVVVDYALRLQKELEAEAVWVAGYSNDVPTYIPSVRVLQEGGYEGGDVSIHTNFPGPWDVTIEQRIIEAVKRLARP